MKKGFLTIVLILILIQISLSGCFNTEESIPTITALEGKNIAEETAKEWHDDFILMDVGSLEGSDGKGGAVKWDYTYFSLSTFINENNITKYERGSIIVTSGFDTKINTRYIVRETYGEPIKNWTIDSDEAVDICKQDSQISLFLSKYPDASVGMNLQMWSEHQDNAVWHIAWSSNVGFDNPKNAEAEVDANTGEIVKIVVYED